MLLLAMAPRNWVPPVCALDGVQGSRTPGPCAAARPSRCHLLAPRPRLVRARGRPKGSDNGCPGGVAVRIPPRMTKREGEQSGSRVRISPMGAEIPGPCGRIAERRRAVSGRAPGGHHGARDVAQRHQPHLYRFGLRMCGNVEDAGDVAQESLISMARSLRDFRGDSSVSSWLYTIARRFCIKKRRRSKFAPTREESLDTPDTDVAQHLADPTPNPEQTATNRELATALRTPSTGWNPLSARCWCCATSKGYRRQKWPDPGHERRGRQEPPASGEGRHP